MQCDSFPHCTISPVTLFHFCVCGGEGLALGHICHGYIWLHSGITSGELGGQYGMSRIKPGLATCKPNAVPYLLYYCSTPLFPFFFFFSGLNRITMRSTIMKLFITGNDPTPFFHLWTFTTNIYHPHCTTPLLPECLFSFPFLLWAYPVHSVVQWAAMPFLKSVGRAPQGNHVGVSGSLRQPRKKSPQTPQMPKSLQCLA